MKKKLKLRSWVKYTLLIILLVGAVIYLDKDNDEFLEVCTQNLSESTCRKGM